MGKKGIKKIEKCLKCCKFVFENQNSICCDKCKKWIHLRCSGLKKKDFQILCDNVEQSFSCNFCKDCRCGNCDKPVFDCQNGIQCDSIECKKWYHLTCSKLSKNSMMTTAMVMNRVTGYAYATFLFLLQQ